MSIKSYSGFTYGHEINSSNDYINFDEGGGEVASQIEIGSYTLNNFLGKVLEAFNAEGGQEYSGTIDRATRKITITATTNFDLLVTTGTQSTISAFSLMGFTIDKTGSNSYESDVASGFFYEPQFLLQNYVSFEDNVKTAQASVNESASGVVEIVSFGKNQFMECNITLATDIIPQGAIKENATGVSDLRSFMNYAINKNPLEVVFDLENPDLFEACLLEKTQIDSKGTGFKLYELYARKLVGYFETKSLTFRKL
jgi:hypothetical protein